MYEIEGFADYLIDDQKQVYRKPTKWRFGSCKCITSVKKMKLTEYGKYQMRRGCVQYRLTPDEAWELRKGQEKSTGEGVK